MYWFGVNGDARIVVTAGTSRLGLGAGRAADVCGECDLCGLWVLLADASWPWANPLPYLLHNQPPNSHATPRNIHLSYSPSHLFTFHFPDYGVHSLEFRILIQLCYGFVFTVFVLAAANQRRRTFLRTVVSPQRFGKFE
jgi:hypothetical protein